MAITACVEFLVRTDGDDSNGGGFNQHRTLGSLAAFAGVGTDRSNSAAPFVTFDGVTITASNGSAGATITISGYTVVNADAGNLVKITAGTNFTAGTYEIINVSTGSNTWTLDRNCTTAAGSAMVAKMGGGRLTIASAVGDTIDNNTIHVKSGTYTLTAAVSYASKGLNFFGFQTTKLDYGTRPLITTATNTTALFTPTSGFGKKHSWTNINFSNTASTRAAAITSGQGLCSFTNCIFDGFTKAVDCNATSMETQVFCNCEVKNCTAEGIYVNSNLASSGIGVMIYNCFIHDNTTIGVYLKATNAGAIINNSIIANNGSDGIKCDSSEPQLQIIRCTIANNGGNGINLTAAGGLSQFEENIIYGNTSLGYAVTWVTSNLVAQPLNDRNNAFGSNGGGNRQTGMSNGTNQIALSADPFTNSASRDYTLNSTSGGGASLKNISVNYTTQTNYSDIGGLQSAVAVLPSTDNIKIRIGDPLVAR